MAKKRFRVDFAECGRRLWFGQTAGGPIRGEERACQTQCKWRGWSPRWGYRGELGRAGSRHVRFSLRRRVSVAVEGWGRVQGIYKGEVGEGVVVGAIHSDIRPCTKIPSTKIVSIDHHHTLPHSTLSHRHTSSILGTPLSADRHCLASPITPSRHQIYAQKRSSCARRPPVIHAVRIPNYLSKLVAYPRLTSSCPRHAHPQEAPLTLCRQDHLVGLW